MKEKIKGLLQDYEPFQKRYTELLDLLFSPEIIADNKLYLRLAEEKNSLEEIYTLGEALKIAVELEEKKEIEALYTLLTNALLPKGQNDVRSAIIELKAINPESRALLNELFNMYLNFAKSNNYKVDVCEEEPCFLSFTAHGNYAYYKLKGETGTHVSIGGKIGNCQVSVSVHPILDDVTVNINKDDLRTDIFHSSGAGGQNVNKVATAVRLTHLPSGIVVVCKEERSQLQNRNRALEIMRVRLYDYYSQIATKNANDDRRQTLENARKQRLREYDFDNEKIFDYLLNIFVPLKKVMSGGLESELINPKLIKEAK